MLVDMIEAKGLKISVAWISGDEVLSIFEQELHHSSRTSSTQLFKNIQTGETLSEWKAKYEAVGAQAYLGGLGIAEAFKQGAQIVVCGRVSDASPYIGAAYWWHGWERSMSDRLANALVAGHLLECSTYVTGGNYSGFQDLEHVGSGWTDLGFPIGEISKDGGVVITKQKDTGGMLTVDTCSSQLYVTATLIISVPFRVRQHELIESLAASTKSKAHITITATSPPFCHPSGSSS